MSTAFDFMAICSAPTWLGQERRRSRRRKSYFPQPSPLAMNVSFKASVIITEEPDKLP